MEAIGWEPEVDSELVSKVRDESLSQQNRDYRAAKDAGLRQSAKHKALSGEAVTLSQLGGVAPIKDNKPNKKEDVI